MVRELFPLWLPGCLLSSALPKETLLIYVPLGGKFYSFGIYVLFAVRSKYYSPLQKPKSKSERYVNMKCHVTNLPTTFSIKMISGMKIIKGCSILKYFGKKMSSYISHQKSRPSKTKNGCVNITSQVIKCCFYPYFSINFLTIPWYPAITCFTVCKNEQFNDYST